MYSLENIFYFITLFDSPSLQGNINWCNTIIIVHRPLRGNKTKSAAYTADPLHK